MNVSTPKSFIMAAFVLIFVFLIIVWVVGIEITLGQFIVFIFAIAIIIAFLFILLRTNKEEDSMQKVMYFVLDWWDQVFKEQLQLENMVAYRTYFEEKPFYAFIFRRLRGQRAGIDICLGVETTGGAFKVAKVIESANIRHTDDPFAVLRTVYPGSPVPVKNMIPPEMLANAGKEAREKFVINVGKNEKEDFTNMEKKG